MTFPLDWNEWQRDWNDWKRSRSRILKRATLTAAQLGKSKNFLADEILGTWLVNGRNVELSEVVFPSFERDAATGRLLDDKVRRIGITYITDAGLENGGVVSSFDELEAELGIKPGGALGRAMKNYR